MQREVRESLTYFRDDLLGLLRSPKGWLVLGSYLLFQVVLTLPYVGLSKVILLQLGQGAGPSGRTMLDAAQPQLMAQAFAKLTGSVEEGLAMAQIPLPALYTFTLAALFLPLLVMLLGSDLVADDLRSGHIRYLVLRSSRASLLAGRAASRAVLLAATVLLGAMTCFGVFWWKLDGLAPDAFGHFVRLGFMLVAMVPTYVGLVALCSGAVKSSFFALLLGIALLLAFGVVDLASDLLGLATPNHYKLLLYSPLRWWIGVLAHLGFGVLYGGAAYAVVRTRDI
jgi:ABC-type transport system involved in multi-copper enzyme maturation permease subunit